MSGGFVINDAPAGGGAVDTDAVLDALATADPMTGDEWETGTPSGGASAAWEDGALVLTAPAASGAAIQVTRDDLIPTPTRYLLALRVDITTGDGVAGADGQIVWSVGAASASRFQMQIKSDGNVEVTAYGVNGAGQQLDAALATGISAGQRTGGQLWYALDVSPAEVSLLWGIGVGDAVPTLWRVAETWTSSHAILSAQGSWCGISVYTPSSVSGGYAGRIPAIYPVARP